jgi:hypothetical protein
VVAKAKPVTVAVFLTMLRKAVAIPYRVLSTELRIALAFGEKKVAIPIPPITNNITTTKMGVLLVNLDNPKKAPVDTINPPMINHLAPNWSDKRPATGPIMEKQTGVAIRNNPVCRGL